MVSLAVLDLIFATFPLCPLFFEHHLPWPDGPPSSPGDYNTAPDRHLGAANIERLNPDLLISESTYATTLRDSRRARERDFLQAVHDCVSKGGKVLVPVFAVGRAQELLMMVEEHWERMGIKVSHRGLVFVRERNRYLHTGSVLCGPLNLHRMVG